MGNIADYLPRENKPAVARAAYRQTVRESCAGVWQVNDGETGGKNTVYLYRSGIWKCTLHGAMDGPNCIDARAVLAIATRCQGEQAFVSEKCSEVACDTVRIDGAPTPLCPTCLYAVEKAVS